MMKEDDIGSRIGSRIATIIHELQPTGDDRLDERLEKLTTQDPKKLPGDVLTLIRVVKRQHNELVDARAERADLRAELADLRAAADARLRASSALERVTDINATMAGLARVRDEAEREGLVVIAGELQADVLAQMEALLTPVVVRLEVLERDKKAHE